MGVVELVFRIARRIAGSLLPILSIGLLVVSFTLDDWYSVEYLEGTKEEGSIWREYKLDYGLYEFRYLEVWSGILGDNFIEMDRKTTGELEDLSDYIVTSMCLLILLLALITIFGLSTLTDRFGTGTPMVMCLIVVLGSLLSGTFYMVSIENAVAEHLENNVDPAGIELEDDERSSLEDSGRPGDSSYLLLSSAIPAFISFLLFIDPKKDRDPSISDIEKGFFR